MTDKNHYEGYVLHPKVKAVLTGKNEELIKKLIESLSFKEHEDFIHQYPFVSGGNFHRISKYDIFAWLN